MGPPALTCPSAAQSWGAPAALLAPACGSAGSGSGQVRSWRGLGAQPPTSTGPTALLPCRLLQSAGPALRSGLAGLKVLLLNVSRAVTRDVLITFSPTEVRCTPLPHSEGPVPSKHPSAPAPGLGMPWCALPPPCSMAASQTHVSFSIPWQGVT